jgi:CheY-like chemotaxis protein
VKILISEDDDPKLERLREFILDRYTNAIVLSAGAANATLAALRVDLPDLLLLDMSLPTFEVGRGEPGGRPQDFGGLEVMDFMELEDLICPVVIVTQYEAFPLSRGENMSLDDVASKAHLEHPSMFKRLIYYSSVTRAWEEELSTALESILGKQD